MTKSINKVVLGLDYEAEQTDKYRLLDRLKKTGGLSLHAEIVEMKIKTIARQSRRISSARFKAPSAGQSIMMTANSSPP